DNSPLPPSRAEGMAHRGGEGPARQPPCGHDDRLGPGVAGGAAGPLDRRAPPFGAGREVLGNDARDPPGPRRRDRSREGPPLRPGDEAPPFSGRDLDGKEFSLKDPRGSLVLIDFWASWCHPCEQAVIPIRRLAEQYRGKLRIVGVSLDEDRKAFEAFVYNHHL